jgi:hypothetical protein
MADLLAQRRLADTDLGRRPREVPFLGYGEEVSDVTKLHHHLQKLSSEHAVYIGL